MQLNNHLLPKTPTQTKNRKKTQTTPKSRKLSKFIQKGI